MINIMEQHKEKMMYFRSVLIQAILFDEREYCFDKRYISDEAWDLYVGDKTREEAYADVVDEVLQSSTASLLEQREDQYDYLFEREDIHITKNMIGEEL